MGHTRLGKIPKSAKWRAVVDEVVGGTLLVEGDVGPIAALTLDAATPALEKSRDDEGLRHTFYLLTQVALAARDPNWQDLLSQAGLRLTPDASLFDLTAELQSAVDRRVESRGLPSDVSEMAQQAAGEALASLAAGSVDTLFGTGGQHLQDAVRPLSTKSGFARLGQRFFGSFLTRFLNFYLSRVTASSVGSPRLNSVGAVSEFNKALQTHCEQSARIVRDFCGQWYSKTEYVEGINPENTSRFMAVALRKLSRELAQQRADA